MKSVEEAESGSLVCKRERIEVVLMEDLGVFVFSKAIFRDAFPRFLVL